MWGRNVMMGYLNREDKTSEELTQDGWIRSGDQGIIDQDNFIYITGKLPIVEYVKSLLFLIDMFYFNHCLIKSLKNIKSWSTLFFYNSENLLDKQVII